MTKKPPLLTKSQRALQELEHATTAVNKALSLLGGRTRHKPKKMTLQFTSRQYLEGVASRLAVVTSLLTVGYSCEWQPTSDKPLSDSHGALSDTFPRDEFEAAYDAERDPQC